MLVQASTLVSITTKSVTLELYYLQKPERDALIYYGYKLGRLHQRIKKALRNSKGFLGVNIITSLYRCARSSLLVCLNNPTRYRTKKRFSRSCHSKQYLLSHRK